MTEVFFPAHKICTAKGKHSSFILAATGPCIQSLSLANGKLASIWPRDNDLQSEDESDENVRPSKRLRLDHEKSELSDGSIEIVAEGKERQKGERRRPKVPDTSSPNVSHLLSTTDGQHAVAITAEDKAVRVYRIGRSGRLRQLSCRSMPKKSCAVKLTEDETLILTADKFGDVYSLPLHPSADYQPRTRTPPAEQPFKPSATELTVHTKGNLDALRQQQRQKQLHPKKEGPAFEYKLLLGHVSLLTDLVVAQGTVDGKHRPFIITADRDEHIRVSRGIPQTHIIHAFCLGHTEFVSKLCVVPQVSQVLVAGNGDPSLRLYDWVNGKEKMRYNMLEHHRADLQENMAPERSLERLAVSGLWALSSSSDDKAKGGCVLVTLEGVPLLFNFSVKAFEITHIQTVKLVGNVLDVAQISFSKLAISIDIIHRPGSYKCLHDNTSDLPHAIQIYRTHEESTGDILMIEPDSAMESIPLELETVDTATLPQAREVPEQESRMKTPDKTYSALGAFLYGLENLRKRREKGGDEDLDDFQDDDLGNMPPKES